MRRLHELLKRERKQDDNPRVSFTSYDRISTISNKMHTEKLEMLQDQLNPRSLEDGYDIYLLAMQKVNREAIREREVSKSRASRYKSDKCLSSTSVQSVVCRRISTVASMLPDEIIKGHEDPGPKQYEAVLMVIDVTGFTPLCEFYTKVDSGGPSKLTQILNVYIGDMVQEILSHGGDVLKFSGDAFLAMWKRTGNMSMQDVVHAVIDCGLIVQRSCGSYVTETGSVLKAKISIAAGNVYFSVLGTESAAAYLVIGQPILDNKACQHICNADDLVIAPSAWLYVNESEYFSESAGDYIRVRGIGVSWKRVEKLNDKFLKDGDSDIKGLKTSEDASQMETQNRLRPIVLSGITLEQCSSFYRYIQTPVLRAVENFEPMEYLAEVRRVVVVFVNAVPPALPEPQVLAQINEVYIATSRIVNSFGGLLNKVSMFDKDLMFLVVFGVRGMKQEDEARKGLNCAFKILQTLRAANFFEFASVAVTSGSAYCGVLGHILRREYTVIGSVVNKAARMMTLYCDKVTCDQETFLRSRMEKEYFHLMQYKHMKGVTNPGPIYEFTSDIAYEKKEEVRLSQFLGRRTEIKAYQSALLNALDQHQADTTTTNASSVNQNRFAIAVQSPFKLLREIFKSQIVTTGQHNEDIGFFQDKIETCVDIQSLQAKELYALNSIFGCQFPITGALEVNPDFDPLSLDSTKRILQTLCVVFFKELNLIVIDNAHYMDDFSWRCLPYLLETKSLFIIAGLCIEKPLSDYGKAFLDSHLVMSMFLEGLETWYHAALACHAFNVQGIPAELDAMIQESSGGAPGWIQNFAFSLLQVGAVQIITVSREEAREMNAVLPPSALLTSSGQSDSSLNFDNWETYKNTFTDIEYEVCDEDQSKTSKETKLNVVVLAPGYTYDEIKQPDVSLDAIILSTYDSLTGHEKQVVKCASVLGDEFSRRILSYLLEKESPVTLASTLARLFRIRVLECAGGDMTYEHPIQFKSSSEPLNTEALHCSCVGIQIPPEFGDIPYYGFCGYMKFRLTQFQTTTYNLLTENQRRDLHSKAFLFYKTFGQRCRYCGYDCFAKLLGKSCDEALVKCATSESLTDLPRFHMKSSDTFSNASTLRPSGIGYLRVQSERTTTNKESWISLTHINLRDIDVVPSFPNLDLMQCKCHQILNTVLSESLWHARQSGDMQALLTIYLEYAAYNTVMRDVPTAMTLLDEMQELIEDPSLSTDLEQWQKDMRVGWVYLLRGDCFLQCARYDEAEKTLLRALALFSYDFPHGRVKIDIAIAKERFKLTWRLKSKAPNRANLPALAVELYVHICKTLNTLFNLYTVRGHNEKSELCALMALNIAIKTEIAFDMLCVCYANMMRVFRASHDYNSCKRVVKQATAICRHNKRQPDWMEAKSISRLYLNFFLAFIETGKQLEAIQVGESTLLLCRDRLDLVIRQLVLVQLATVYMMQLRFQEMVQLLRQHLADMEHYDVCYSTWYYHMAMTLHLNTGHYLEPLSECERFCSEQRVRLARCKVPQAAWNLYISLWLMCLRLNAWERSISWENEIRAITSNRQIRDQKSFIMLMLNILEGLIIKMVYEIDGMNYMKVDHLMKVTKEFLIAAKKKIPHSSIYKPRVMFLEAYLKFVKGRKQAGLKMMSRCISHAQLLGDYITLAAAEHNYKHWTGQLSPTLVDQWAELVSSERPAEYTQLLTGKRDPVPYTFPVPRLIINS